MFVLVMAVFVFVFSGFRCVFFCLIVLTFSLILSVPVQSTARKDVSPKQPVTDRVERKTSLAYVDSINIIINPPFSPYQRHIGPHFIANLVC